jgi:dimethylamine/trimethylamine dehydrogenase
MTDEQARIQTKLMQAGVAIHLARKITGWDGATASFASIYDGSLLSISGDALLVVGARAGNDGLEREQRRRQAAGSLPQIQTIRAIGDCHAPGAIYSAVYSGHRAAREFGETIDPDAVGYIRERVALA